MIEYQSISQARNELGLTQQNMADELGIARQTYAKMEAEPENLTIREARLICAILGKRVRDIFFLGVVSENSSLDMMDSSEE